MSNIEDDIKAKGFIEGYKQIKNNESIIKSIDKDFFFELVDYLLEEREQDKARIKELEEELYSANKIINEYLDGIPKQKVKEKIKEAKYNKKVGNTAYEYTEEDVWEIVKDNLEEVLEDT